MTETTLATCALDIPKIQGGLIRMISQEARHAGQSRIAEISQRVSVLQSRAPNRPNSHPIAHDTMSRRRVG